MKNKKTYEIWYSDGEQNNRNQSLEISANKVHATVVENDLVIRADHVVIKIDSIDPSWGIEVTERFN